MRNLCVTLLFMEEVAAAIADAVRRDILLLLRDGDRTAGQIAERFPISRPAISRHLRVLRECGLVRDEAVGRERVYRLDPRPMFAVAEWIAQFAPTGQLGDQLDALETEVYRTRRERRRRTEESPTNEEETA